jgi:hypothetical protein
MFFKPIHPIALKVHQIYEDSHYLKVNQTYRYIIYNNFISTVEIFKNFCFANCK